MYPPPCVAFHVTSRKETSALTACPLSPQEPCQGCPRRERSTPSIPPAHPLLPPNSLVMYKTFPETTYSSCIFHEAGPKLKHINIKISRSTFLKKDMFHKIPRDPFQRLPSSQGRLPGSLSTPSSSCLFFSPLAASIPFLLNSRLLPTPILPSFLFCVLLQPFFSSLCVWTSPLPPALSLSGWLSTCIPLLPASVSLFLSLIISPFSCFVSLSSVFSLLRVCQGLCLSHNHENGLGLKE